METLFLLIIIAVIGEAIVETIKLVIPTAGVLSWERITALIVGLLIAFAVNADIFAMLNIPVVIPFVGTILTGILISRGANFIHDLFAKIDTTTKPKPQ